MIKEIGVSVSAKEVTKVLILGAASDVARELAIEYSRAGASVTLAARDVTRLDSLKSDLTIKYQNIVDLVEFDAVLTAKHQQFYDGLGEKAAVVVCLFGFLGGIPEERSWKGVAEILAVNYVGCVSILNIVATDFGKRGKGVIVGVSSVAGERGRQSNYIYGSAKAGFTAYLSGLRNQMFPLGVHVVSVLPGFIKTKMLQGLKTPAPLTASPNQVARAIIQAVEKKKNVVYVLWMWKWIMLIIKMIPEEIFKKLKL